MLVFIDESGDTGLEPGSGTSKYFVICMVIFEDNEEALACDKRVELPRRELGLPQDFEFHFRRNSNRIREAFLKAILPYQFFHYGIVISKEKLFGDGFKNKESFYKYASGLLFENAKEKLDMAAVVIGASGRKLFKYQLATYLKKRINAPDRRRIKKVKLQDSKGNNLLQLADMVAGSVARSYSSGKKDSRKFRDILNPREIHVQVWPK